jgi:hypothetical protein
VAEQVRGRGRHDEPCLGQGLAERGDPLVPLGLAGTELEYVVVMEVDPVGAELGELAHRPLGGHGRPGGAAEHVDALPADGPDAEREPVFAGGRVTVGGHGSSPFCRAAPGAGTRHREFETFRQLLPVLAGLRHRTAVGSEVSRRGLTWYRSRAEEGNGNLLETFEIRSVL